MAHLGNQTLDAFKDPLDLRDFVYQGSLMELPRWIDHRSRVPLLLDQNMTGACTGFGLAATVNFLLHNQRGAEILTPEQAVSPAMLYEMAKRYDEWEGTRYQGSSIRGALKGWQKHGVCTQKLWPWRGTGVRGRLTQKRQQNALLRPLGNYFRVRHLQLPQMHSALAEVGILFASATVHSGWDQVDPQSGVIPMHDDTSGGHAFAIVGYNQIGFWIQNSWGTAWGRNGFAIITYDDWLRHAWDCWVVRLGVPIIPVTWDQAVVSGQVDPLPYPAVVNSQIQGHVINFGNDGKLSTSGCFQSEEKDVDEIFFQHFHQRSQLWKGTPRIMFFAHGGFNREQHAAARIAHDRPYTLANEIYPVHFMWETGLWDTISNLVADAFRNRRFAGNWKNIRDRFATLVDEAIELATRPLGRPLWSEMKENARLACQSGGAADFACGRLAQYCLQGNPCELHLVGHSAGCLLLGYLLSEIDAWGLRVKSLTLYAPACSNEFFRNRMLPWIGPHKCVQQLTIINLKDSFERADSVMGLYGKSMLYLVSHAFESRPRTQLLGIDAHLREDPVIRSFLGKPVASRGSTVTYHVGGTRLSGIQSDSKRHADFDNDPATLNSTWRIIRGGTALKKEIGGSHSVRSSRAATFSPP